MDRLTVPVSVQDIKSDSMEDDTVWSLVKTYD